MSKLPKGWVTAKLGDISSKLVDGSHNPPKKQDTGLPMLSAANISDYRIHFSSFRHISAHEFEREHQRTRISKGDILLTIVGAIGRTALVNKIERPFTLQRSVAVISPIKIDSSFLMYQFSSPRIAKFFKLNARGTAQKGVYLKTLEAMDIWFPAIDEQKRIVAKIEELFSELDKGTEALKTAQAQLKVYRQALLKHAFEGKLTADWREANKDKLETADQLLARIKAEREARHEQQLTEWKKAVHDWTVGGKKGKKPSKPKKLKDLDRINTDEMDKAPLGWSHVRLGLLVDEPSYGTSKKCHAHSGKTGVLRIPNIISGKIDQSDLKFADFDAGELAAYKLLLGDVLLIRSNGSVSIVGKSATVTELDLDLLYAGYLIRLRPNPSLLISGYLQANLCSHFLRSQIEYAAKSTSGVNNINSGELQNLIIPICSIEEQSEITRRLEAQLSVLDRLQQDVSCQIEKSEALRQSILKKAFSGQLVPQDPSDEPASKLLERIKAENAKAAALKKPKRKKAS